MIILEYCIYAYAAEKRLPVSTKVLLKKKKKKKLLWSRYGKTTFAMSLNLLWDLKLK